MKSYHYQNNHSGNGGFISMFSDTEEVGRLTYTIMPELDKLIISFVNIYPKYEGQGLGKLIIKEAISFARSQSLRIYPHCSYAKVVMQRMDDVEDIFLKA